MDREGQWPDHSLEALAGLWLLRLSPRRGAGLQVIIHGILKRALQFVRIFSMKAHHVVDAGNASDENSVLRVELNAGHVPLVAQRVHGFAFNLPRKLSCVAARSIPAGAAPLTIVAGVLI